MGETSLGDALRAYLHTSPLRHKLNEYRIQALWEKQMGKAISRYTDSISLRQGKLIITTAVAPLKQELNFSRETIKQRFNEALGEPVIETVIIR